jgi:hypothetical protein
MDTAGVSVHEGRESLGARRPRAGGIRRLSTAAQEALAAFIDAVVIVDPIDYQRGHDEPGEPPTPLRTLPFGMSIEGLVTFPGLPARRSCAHSQDPVAWRVSPHAVSGPGHLRCRPAASPRRGGRLVDVCGTPRRTLLGGCSVIGQAARGWPLNTSRVCQQTWRLAGRVVPGRG